jgi:hypothetical protein
MLTSYLVACPQLGCGWRGSLIPYRDMEAWNPSKPNQKVGVFHCPKCNGEWRGRIVGDDVYPLPAQNEAPQLVS